MTQLSLRSLILSFLVVLTNPIFANQEQALEPSLEARIQASCVVVAMNDLSLSLNEAEAAVLKAELATWSYGMNYAMGNIDGVSNYTCKVELDPKTLALVDGYIDISFSNPGDAE